MLQPHLHSPLIQLRPLTAEDFSPLYAVAKDPGIWQGHPSPNRHELGEFTTWFDEALRCQSTLVVLCGQQGQMLGSSRFYDYSDATASLAIGYTFLARHCWGGRYNRELKRLMLEHSFRFVERVWFHVAASNLRSQAAMAKIGAAFSHSEIRTISGKTLEYRFYYINKNNYLQSPFPPAVT
jgi:N-acetyltransferase